jgi:hypothetical protein
MRKLLCLLILVFVSVFWTACGGSRNVKIVGAWEREDKKINATEIFSAGGDYAISNPAITFTGKYEIKDGVLIIRILNKDGSFNQFDSKYKIIEITDDAMIYESLDGTKLSYKKLK